MSLKGIGEARARGFAALIGLKGPGRRRQILVGSVFVLLVLVLVPLVFATLLWTRLDRVDIRLPGSAAGGTTYLLLGSDTRSDTRAGIRSAADRQHFGDTHEVPGSDADLMLLLRVPDHGRRQLLSVPRDLLVFDAKHSLVRLGPTLNGGPQPVVDAICRSLGIGVDHVAIVGFLECRSQGYALALEVGSLVELVRALRTTLRASHVVARQTDMRDALQ